MKKFKHIFLDTVGGCRMMGGTPYSYPMSPNEDETVAFIGHIQ